MGFTFDLTTWDGSDIFYPERGSGPLITAELRSRLIGGKFRNFVATPIAEVRRNKAMIDQMIETRTGPYSETVGYEYD